ncbi:MAG: fatty acid desaturase [Gemmatimonadales bacterium]|nr:fatty acid desaturase [Gemmatimonadales bacterium]
MTEPKLAFKYSAQPEPHRARTKAILKRHPEVRDLIGKNPMTFWYALGIVAGQTALAIALRQQPWWLVLLVAYFVGAFANHALFVVIHECAHKLVFRHTAANIWTGILANFPLSVPASVSFTKYHIKHHAFQGVYELDADLPFHWEARLVGRSWWRKAVWLLLFPVIEGIRPMRLKEVPFWDRWSVVNITLQFAFDAAVLLLFGPKALAYLVLSLFFGIGLHPLGARWVQRHFLVEEGEQETYSYYGALNRLALNVGYHNEHHDFPSVPWNNLPKVKEAAPEVYDGLAYHQSWTKLLFRFLFDPSLTLYSRIVRQERGKVELDDAVEHDRETATGTAPPG